MPTHNYNVHYRIDKIMSPHDDPFIFECEASTIEKAEDCCLNAFPDADIVGAFLVPETKENQ